jgi:heme-degrading monooxygenase HmoA
VSVTDFHVRRLDDLLRVYLEGWRLRRSWASMRGAVGMWLWSKPRERRSGSVSVWRDEQDLRRFVLSSRHREVMRRYRDVGELSSGGWLEDRFDPELVWSKAAGRLATAGHARPDREGER